MELLDIIKIAAAVLALAIAIIGHEIMHGWIAYMYGDMTAKNAGRLTINPLVHIDLVGTIIVPAMLYFLPLLFGSEGGILFGWAKPVPINMFTVVKRGGYNAAMQVDMAGIVYNFTLAAFAAIGLTLLHAPTVADSWLYIFTYILVYQLLVINVVLGVFNALPIPQFDGGHFVTHLALKFKYYSIAEFYNKYEQYGMIIVLAILMTPLNQYVIFMPVQYIINLLLS
jgi:Zn-dependent protease